jgi:hypothetical protein
MADAPGADARGSGPIRALSFKRTDTGGAQDGELSSEGGSEKGGDDSDHEEELVREEVGAT